MASGSEEVAQQRDEGPVGRQHRVVGEPGGASGVSEHAHAADNGAEIHAAALADPDEQPLTEEKLARPKRVPRAKSLRRRALGRRKNLRRAITSRSGTLRDWEQGRSEPDQPARASLKVIAGDPEGVRRALEPGPKPRLDQLLSGAK